MRSYQTPEKHAFIYFNQSTERWHWIVNNGAASLRGDDAAWHAALTHCDAAMHGRLAEQYREERDR